MKVYRYKIDFRRNVFFAYANGREIYALALSRRYVPKLEQRIEKSGGTIFDGDIGDPVPVAIRKYFTNGKIPTEIKPKPLWGTDFQKKAWKKISGLCVEGTTTYGAIANSIGKPRASRAVVSAVGANPIAIIIPCHRVLAKNGIGGFGGDIELKQKLLEIEGFLTR